MRKLVVFDDHHVVLDRVERWLAAHPGVELELDRAASQRIMPDGWQSVKDRVRALAGPVLIILDLRLRFESKTREKIHGEFPAFPPMLSPEMVDGYAVANLIMRSEDLAGSVVVVNSTIGVGDDLMQNLRSVAQALGVGDRIRFVGTRTALSVGLREADEILSFAAREVGVAAEAAGSGERENDPTDGAPLSGELFRARLMKVCGEHPLFGTPFVRRLSEPAGISLSQLRRFAALYYPHVLRTRRYQAAALAICPEEEVQAALAAILYDEYGRSSAAASHPSLYRRFLESLEVPEEEWLEDPQVPELAMYIRSLEQISRSQPWRFAVGAVGLGGELPIPRLYSGFLEGFGSRLSDGATEIFRLHVEVDEAHSEILVDALTSTARRLGHQAELEEGLKCSLDWRVVVLEAIGREVAKV